MEELSERISEYFQDEKFLNRLALRGYEEMMESFDKRINELIINNTNNNTTINNYNNNIDKVELKQVNNVEDVFRGLKNMAIQRTFRR